MTNDGEARTRIQAEYLEMPGMKLTLAQASRLFNLPPERCAKVLDTLVTDGVLRTDGRVFIDARGGKHHA